MRAKQNSNLRAKLTLIPSSTASTFPNTRLLTSPDHGHRPLPLTLAIAPSPISPLPLNPSRHSQSHTQCWWLVRWHRCLAQSAPYGPWRISPPPPHPALNAASSPAMTPDLPLPRVREGEMEKAVVNALCMTWFKKRGGWFKKTSSRFDSKKALI
jgi:hypothetical protein